MIITHETLWAFKPKIRRQWLQNNPDLRLAESIHFKSTLPPVKSRKRQGFVYLIKCNEFTKIGCSFNPQGRLAELSTSSPYELSLLRLIPSPQMATTEAAIHNYLKEFHHTREWFKLPNHTLQSLLSSPDDWFLKLSDDYDISLTINLIQNSQETDLE